jgi:hypothetical protein
MSDPLIAEFKFKGSACSGWAVKKRAEETLFKYRQFAASFSHLFFINFLTQFSVIFE